MDHMITSSPMRTRPSPVLYRLVILNILTLALVMGLLVWGVVDGWVFEDNNASDMHRIWLEQASLLAILLSIGIVWATGRPSASLTGRARRRAAWWDRMHSAVRLAAVEGNEVRRSAGLLMLEQLGNDPDATREDREMLREVVTALKTEGSVRPEADHTAPSPWSA